MTATQHNEFTIGSLVRARGREWVVLPGGNSTVLHVKPIGGTDEETTRIHTGLESVEPATFAPPASSDLGDYRSGRLLREAVRLSSRAASGPFRSFARIAVEPRPYQFVPLMLALRQDVTRLLIADDVGVGKTVEAILIMRELLDRGEIKRFAVLCPPHLAEQWQTELREKFHIEAERVLSSTVKKLENGLRLDETVFDRYPFTVVSMDYIKAEKRRTDFLRTAPEFIIIDEAHTCASGEGVTGKTGQHQRHQLVKELAQEKERHILLVTATPHSGNEGAFRSLLTVLNKDFYNLPDDLSGEKNEPVRRKLAQYLVQRKRQDIRSFMQEDTPFPDRLEPNPDITYKLSGEYLKFLDKVLAYARELVSDETIEKRHQRIRWWAALSLLRSVGSSPAAAAAALRSRAAVADAETDQDIEEIGKRSVLDQDDSEQEYDLTPGTEIDSGDTERRYLRDLAREVEQFQGKQDTKLQKLIPTVKELLAEGLQPIVFCRFINTAEYVAEHLQSALGKDVEVTAVTGKLTPQEREMRVSELSHARKRVLVATDCLSEGINLQHAFSAVLHYDLSWNPTRHEQREGRVDRYGQPSKQVKVITYYGTNNPVDGIVLDVLIKKHKRIRSSLGISVPVPVDNDQVVQAVLSGLLMRDSKTHQQGMLFDSEFKAIDVMWDNTVEREKRSRTMFAQQGVKVEEVSLELDSVRSAIGSGVNVEQFVTETLKLHGGFVTRTSDGAYTFDTRELPRALKDALGEVPEKARFALPVADDETYLSRTHPFVEALATHLMDSALDPLSSGEAKRASVTVTSQVTKPTVLLVARFRYHLITQATTGDRDTNQQLAEEVYTLGFNGAPTNPQWLSEQEARKLLDVVPTGSVEPERAKRFLENLLGNLHTFTPHLNERAEERARLLLEAHQRVRSAASLKYRYSTKPILPVDIVGTYVYLPQ
ncbi:helicase-related protein [Deinococcus roseus]|uniref:ATP-dependent helicase HepA n=1 Tax=Deinococcus roseus TaxID=392414 RepID=A0ABQ2CV27_9DEIO|nr:helicase-related protein [Deinococcus roseus]GGJ23517.1 ATP-dependent helicase HepA [Deinococcus roseus]